ncbi:MAG: oxidoreductase, partial [Nocardioidaceae bacterium]
FRNTNPDAFYDCMAFSRDGTGLAMSDPVDGYFRLARTTDFGQSWEVLPTTGMPPARDNEFGFAASGTCVISGPGHVFRIATGGTQPRIFRTWDAGNHWSVHNAPVRGGDTAGIYSIAFRWLLQGVIVGGDFNDETNGADAAASTRSGGWHWQLSREQVGGYRSGVEFVPHTLGTVVAVGPTGSDVSYDGGRTWTGFDTDWYDGVQCARDGACWASGTDGRVAKLQRSWR